MSVHAYIHVSKAHFTACTLSRSYMYISTFIYFHKSQDHQKVVISIGHMVAFRKDGCEKNIKGVA